MATTKKAAKTKADGKGKWWEGYDPQELYTGRNIVMPDGMNGLQFAREVRRRYPDLPVVLVSGYSESLAEAGEEFTVIAKPLTQAALAEAIRRLFVEQSPPRIVVDNTR